MSPINYTLSDGAAMVLIQGTLFAHHSHSPTLTFWRRDFSLNERDAESKNLTKMSNFSWSESMNLPNRSCIRVDCYVTTQVNVPQN